MTTAEPAALFKEGGFGSAIVQARTVEQMLREARPARASVVYECGTDFCGDCACCLACYPDCCEGGCSP
jgi:hypothetical protein